MIHFSELLKKMMGDRCVSKYETARRSGIDASYVTRLTQDDRLPSRKKVNALANGLNLSDCERRRLLLSAGYLPATHDEVLDRVLMTLTDDKLSENAVALFRAQIMVAAVHAYSSKAHADPPKTIAAP